jgi:hypothetical protein
MRGLEISPELSNVTLIGVTRVEKEDVEYQSFTLVSTFERYRAVVITPPDTTETEE